MNNDALNKFKMMHLANQINSKIEDPRDQVVWVVFHANGTWKVTMTVEGNVDLWKHKYVCYSEDGAMMMMKTLNNYR